MKIRRGGVLTDEFEQRVLDGDHKAMRALLRQAVGVNTLDTRVRSEGTVAAPEWRAAGDSGRLGFTGYASVTNVGFTIPDMFGDYTEIVHTGAFGKTLAEGADVIFCFNHDWDAIPMARSIAGTVRMSEDSNGLAVEADLDGSRADVYALQSAMEAGELNAMSFAFWVTRQQWSPDYDQRDILELDMDGGDVSVVTHPANPATTGTTALRKAQARALLRTRVPALVARRAADEQRAGATLSTATMNVLQQVLDLVADADVAVDSAQPLLAALMGVPNPDVDAAAPVEAPQTASTGPDPALVRERLRLRAQAAA